MDDNGKWLVPVVWLIVAVMFAVLVYALYDGNLRPTEDDILGWMGVFDSPDGT